MLLPVLSTIRLLWARLRFAIYYSFTQPTRSHVRMFRFGLPFILKVTGRLHSTEAESLIFLAEAERYMNKKFSVPRLVDSYSDPLTGKSYALMARIEGKSLRETISTMSEEQRLALYDEISQFLQDLWRIPQPVDIAGRVMCGATGHSMPDPCQFYEDVEGPFPSILSCYAYLGGYGDSVQDLLENHPSEVYTALAADDIVFTHIDLRPYNILVGEDGRLAGIIDWEDAGWLPRHWSLHVLRTIRAGCGPRYIDYWKSKRFEENTEAAFTASYSVLRYYL